MTTPQAALCPADVARLAEALVAVLAAWWRQRAALPARPDHAGGAPTTREGD